MRWWYIFFVIIFIKVDAQQSNLVFPKDDVVFSDTTITFQWNGDTVNYTFDLEIAEDTDFSINLISYADLETDNFIIDLTNNTKI